MASGKTSFVAAVCTHETIKLATAAEILLTLFFRGLLASLLRNVCVNGKKGKFSSAPIV